MNNLMVIDNIKGKPFFYYYTFSENSQKIHWHPSSFFNAEINIYLLKEQHFNLYELIDLNKNLPDLLKLRFIKCDKKKLYKRKKIKKLLYLRKTYSNYDFKNIDKKGYKYERILNKIQDINSDIEFYNEIIFYKVYFKESLISYCEQTEQLKIAYFLKSLVQNNGISFDKYIENWTNRLMQEFNLK